MNALMEVWQGTQGAKFINWLNPFNIVDENGKATDGKRVNLTSHEGIGRCNVTAGVAEMRDALATAIEEGAETVNFSFILERSDTGKPCKQIAKLIAKRKIRASKMITRLGGYYYRNS